MRFARIALLGLIGAAALSFPANAGPKCVCRANGTTFEEGQIACIRLPSGNKLARCEKVLNNTSWKMLGDGCPSVLMSYPAQQEKTVPVSLPEPKQG